jgi:hypothetical protein
MKKGAQPARAGVPLAVAPKENGPPWRSNDRVFSLIIKRIPTCDVLGTPCALARSKAHENRQKFSPILSDPLVALALMP